MFFKICFRAPEDEPFSNYPLSQQDLLQTVERNHFKLYIIIVIIITKKIRIIIRRHVPSVLEVCRCAKT